MSIPTGLRLAAVCLLFSVPLAVFESVVVTRSPWWRIPVESMKASGLLAFVLFAPLALTLLRARRWALTVSTILALIWCAGTAWMAVRDKNTSLGFFLLGLVTYWIVQLYWVKFELGRSFLDPGFRWFQGVPEAIPGLKAMVGRGSNGQTFKVSRIDQDGAYLFFRETAVETFVAIDPKIVTQVSLAFRNRQLSFDGRWVSLFDRGQGARGMGLQFEGLSPDAKKDLGDFIESLRGEGHV